MGEAGPDDATAVRAIFDATMAVHERTRDAVLPPVIDAAAAIRAALGAGGKLLTFGNGGSAADAQHMATELVGRFMRERMAQYGFRRSRHEQSQILDTAINYRHMRAGARVRQ